MAFLLSGRVRIFLFFCGLPVFAGSPGAQIRNFYQVDQHVYRGAQPAGGDFQYLANIGVKTVIDLREADERSRAEERAVTAAGMKYVNVPMTGLTPPTTTETNRILAILEENSPGAVFVHCKRGADRTGAVIAAYRIDHDHWDNARALSEAMTRGMSFFQFPRQSYIRAFQPRIIDTKTAATEASSATPAASDAMTVAPPGLR
jgi:tyrosine-protein phosphatase SIW14